MKNPAMPLNGFIVLAVLLFIGSTCFGQEYIPKPDEEIYGTWVNEKKLPQKEIVTAEKWEEYNRSSDSDPFYVGTWEITARWTDSQGNIWYRTLVTIIGGEGGVVGTKRVELSRISRSGAVWEHQWRWLGAGQDREAPRYPEEIDSKAAEYGIFTRVTE